MNRDEKIKADNNPFDNTSVVESVVVDSQVDSSVVVLSCGPKDLAERNFLIFDRFIVTSGPAWAALN